MNAFPQGAQAAISLTYDDGLDVHHQRIAGRLRSAGITATFYVPGKAVTPANMLAWRSVADMGHELGNHSLFHPCRKVAAHKTWLPDAYDLTRYTPQRWKDEMTVANTLLSAIDGQQVRTFGNTCHDICLGADEATVTLGDLMPGLFLCARGARRPGTILPAEARAGKVDRFNLGTVAIDGMSIDALRAQIDEAEQLGGWKLLTMHGVGADTHRLHLTDDIHEQLVQELSRRRQVWAASVREVAQAILAA